MTVHEPPIGWLVVDPWESHEWFHAPDGDWYCSCGNDIPFEWSNVVAHIGADNVWRCTFKQVESPPES